MDPRSSATAIGRMIEREDKRERLFARNGHDWSDRFPLIVEAALRNRHSSLVINGEPCCSASTGDRISTACTPTATRASLA